MKQKLFFNFGHNQDGSAKRLFLIVISAVFIFAIIGSFHSKSDSASADSPEVRSGIKGLCLDDRHSDHKPGAEVDDYSCNQTDAQNWTRSMFELVNGDGMCLSVAGDATTSGSNVVLDACANSPGQIWLNDNGGLYNPNSKLCLDEPDSSGGKAVIVNSCGNLSEANVQWSTDSNLNCADLTSRSDKVACYAAQEWNTWQSGNPSHESLLTTYTDGAPYEEWCADFVSYIYKEAGYPFDNGEAGNGYWDESNANLIQNQGFTKHSPSDYTPKPGDVAFFDYTGGHVEIVISGGAHPSFIYGNSAIIDPSTGNGQMEANTITKDGSLGNLVYYMSPN